MSEIADIELGLLLNAIYLEYGYDFRDYAKAHIKRRLRSKLLKSKLASFSEMQHRVLYDKKFAAEVIQELSITVTEMFRDPEFYMSFRKNVVPILKTYPFIKIWHAGCATGEEVYSMAILLQEEGLYQRATIYATDINQKAIEAGKSGIFANERIKEYTANYQQAGGKMTFSDYYTAEYDMVIMNQSLKENIVWANHNLVTDSAFAEVHLILCRNVLIYFNRKLQSGVQKLFYDSLIGGGILCLGTKESLLFSGVAELYTELDKRLKIYKKKYE